MKIAVEYDRISGYISIPNSMNIGPYYVGIDLNFPEIKNNTREKQIVQDKVVLLAQEGMSATDLIDLKRAGII